MKTVKFLIMLFFVGLAIRAAVFYGYLNRHERYWQVDSNTYHVVAQQIAAGKGISNVDGTPHFYRLPGYPMFLALCYKIFGVSKSASLWVQVFLAAFIPVLIFLLAQSLFPGSMFLAYACAGCSLFHLGLVLYSGFFMTETLFLLLFLLFLIFFFRARNLFSLSSPSLLIFRETRQTQNQRFFPVIPVFSDDLGSDYHRIYDALSHEYFESKGQSIVSVTWQQANQCLVFAALFLGSASLVRPVGHYLVVVTMLIIFLSKDLWHERLVKSSLVFFTWLMVISCWLVRNYLLTGVIFFHTLPGGHFLYLSAARVAMHVHQVSYQQARDLLEKNVRATIMQREEVLGHTISEIEACTIHEKLALKYFMMRPLIALKYWVTDMLRASLSLYSAELIYLESDRKKVNYFEKDRSYWNMFKRYLVPETSSWWLRLVIYVEIILFALLLIGFIGFIFTGFKWCTHYQDILVVKLPFIVLFIVISLSGGYARMRLPIEPLIMILSGAWWMQRIKNL